MSRKLVVLFLAMLVLAGAMGLKTVIACHNGGAVMMASGGGTMPTPKKLVGAPTLLSHR
jgi:hypothetical protein